jgi:MinD-like ATPase involved in chromosome partitioning or flagellar assembly
MTGPLRILLLGPEAAQRPVAGAGIEYHPCADLADLLGRAAAGAADGALLSPVVAGVDAVVVADLRARGCRPVGWVAGSAEVDLAQRSGLTDCLADPIDPAALRALVTAPLPPAALPAPGGPGRVIAVWGPPGSPGRSTVAALLAVGARRAGSSVMIVDADLAGPRWSLVAESGHHSAGLVAAARRAAAGSPDLADLTVRIADDVALLPGLPDPDRWLEIVPGSAAPLLAAASLLAETVIVDLPADIRPAHPAYDLGWAHDAAAFPRAVLAAADAVVPVLAAEPLGVHRFASWWPVLQAQAEPAMLVANAVGHPQAGRRPAEQLTAVLAALGIDAPGVQVPWQPKAAHLLLAGGWAAARGWRRTPEQLWQTMEAAASAAA